jgi:hypothetical protein
MTASTLLDYDADARTRLWELLERRNISCRDQLKQSVDTASAQLEWFKPYAMGRSKQQGARLYAGPAVAAPPGTVLIVLAHEEKAFTVWLRSPGHALIEAVDEAVGYFKALMETEIDLGLTLVAIEDLIKKHDRIPDRKPGIELSQEHNTRIIGMLFAAMSDRAGVCETLEMAMAAKACPAMVGLIGKGSETGLCGAWPLVLPLAPYLDAVIKE